MLTCADLPSGLFPPSFDCVEPVVNTIRELHGMEAFVANCTHESHGNCIRRVSLSNGTDHLLCPLTINLLMIFKVSRNCNRFCLTCQ